MAIFKSVLRAVLAGVIVVMVALAGNAEGLRGAQSTSGEVLQPEALSALQTESRTLWGQAYTKMLTVKKGNVIEAQMPTSDEAAYKGKK